MQSNIKRLGTLDEYGQNTPTKTKLNKKHDIMIDDTPW